VFGADPHPVEGNSPWQEPVSEAGFRPIADVATRSFWVFFPPAESAAASWRGLNFRLRQQATEAKRPRSVRHPPFAGQ